MKINILILVLFFAICSCNNEDDKKKIQKESISEVELLFDKEKWSIKKGASYPFREQMLNNVIYNDSIRSLKRTEIIDLLGEPTRVQDDYIYYLLEKNKVLLMTLNSKTLVIKFKEDESVEWMKIHE